MEWNPLKWLERRKMTADDEEEDLTPRPLKYTRQDKKDIKESGGKYTWYIDFERSLSEEEQERADQLVESWKEHAHVLRSSPGNREALNEISLRQAEIRRLFGNSPEAQAEAEVLLANISVDIEASHQAGEFSEQTYQTYSALGEINVFNNILKGKPPEWADKYLPTLSKMVARGLSVRSLISSGLVYGGGILAGATLSPWILGTAVTVVGAIHGGNIARAWARQSAEEKFDRQMVEMKERVQLEGVDSIPDDEIKRYAKELLVGVHRFGKVVGVDEEQGIDVSSIPAQVLIRLDSIIKEEAKEGLNTSERESLQEIEELRGRGEHEEDIARLFDRETLDLEKKFVQRVLDKKSQGMQEVFSALRKDQRGEHMRAGVGAAGGMLLSTVMRAAGAMAFRGQTLTEFVKSHFSLKADARAALNLLDLGEKGLKAARPSVEAAQKMVGDAVTNARLQIGALHIPGGIEPPPLHSSGGGGTPSVAAVEATRAATVSPGATESTPSMPPASAGATVDTPAQPASARTPGVPVRVPDQPESFSDKVPAGMPEDWAMLKFLGQQLGDEVQKNLASARAGSFPASERGTLLNVLYNLKEQGLIRMEGDHVVLKTDDATLLGRMYQESHASPHATADTYGKKIGLEHWKEWFGGEESRHANVPVHEAPKGHAHGTEIKTPKVRVIAQVEAEKNLNGAGGVEPLPHMRDDIGTAAHRALGARFGEAQDLAAAAVQPASPSDAVVQPSAPSGAEAAPVSQPVVPASPESVTGTIAEQYPASVSAKVEPPIPQKITGQTVDTGGKISGTAVSGEGTGHIKAEAVAEAPKATPALSTTELAHQAYQHMQDSLYKKYGIVPYVVDQIQGLRVSSFLERVAEVKAGKMDLRSAFSSDQFSLKEYEKLASYLTDHDPNAGEKRMLLKNYLLSKEK